MGGAGERQRAAHRFRVIQADQLAPLALERGHPYFGERFQRTDEWRPLPPRAFRHAALLAPIARQEHDDAVSFAELIRTEHQGIGGVERNEPDYFTLFAALHACQIPRI